MSYDACPLHIIGNTVSIKKALASIIFISISISAHANEVSVGQYQAALATKDKEVIEVISMYVAGLGHGLEWANANSQDSPMFCVPNSLVLSTSNYADILDSEIRKLTSQNKNTAAKNLNKEPLGLYLLLGMTSTFPC